MAVSPASHTTRQVSLTLGCRSSERRWPSVGETRATAAPFRPARCRAVR